MKSDSNSLSDKAVKHDSCAQLDLSLDELDLDKQTVDESSYKIDNFIKKFEVDLRFLDNISEKDTAKSSEHYETLKLKDFHFQRREKIRVESESESISSDKADLRVASTPTNSDIKLNTNQHEYTSANIYKSTSKSFSLLNSRIDEEPENEYSYLNVPIVSFKMDDSMLRFNGSFQSFTSKNEVKWENYI